MKDAAGGRGRTRRQSASTTTSSPSTPTGFEAWDAAACDAAPGTRSSSASGIDRERDAGARRSCMRVERADHRLLGDGPDAAQERRRHHPGDRQPPAAAREHRQARRRRLPGPRPQQRPGRPHDGHLGAARRRRSSTGWRRLRLRPAARPRPRHRGDASGPCAEGRAKVFFAMGGNFLSATPDTELTAEALRRTPADRARLDQAQPLAPRHRPRRRSSCPAWAAPSATSRPRGAQFVTVENSMGVVHAVAGPPAPGLGAAAREPAIVAGLARGRRSARGSKRRLGSASPPTTTASAT